MSGYHGATPKTQEQLDREELADIVNGRWVVASEEEYEEQGRRRRELERRIAAAELPALAVGTLVKHRARGYGRIIDIDGCMVEVAWAASRPTWVRLLSLRHA